MQTKSKIETSSDEKRQLIRAKLMEADISHQLAGFIARFIDDCSFFGIFFVLKVCRASCADHRHGDISTLIDRANDRFVA